MTHHTQAKGAKVDADGQGSKTSSRRAGLIRALRVFLRGPASGASSAKAHQSASPPTAALVGRPLGVCAPQRSSSRAWAAWRRLGRRGDLGAAGVVVVGLGMLFLSGPVFAGNPPKIYYESQLFIIYPTRVTTNVVVGMVTSNTTWRLEYATSEALLDAGSGALAGSGTCLNSPNQLESSCVENPTIQHLKPQTTYYIRATASNESGNASATIKVTTTAVSAPEIACRAIDEGKCGTAGENIRPVKLGTTFEDYEAQVQTNGAETEYVFKSATAKGGPWVPIPGASGKVTVAEDFANPHAHLEGLTPETLYCIQLTVKSEKGEASEETCQPTATIKPRGRLDSFSKVTGASAHLLGGVDPATYETHWRFEYTRTPAVAASWVPVPGGEGVIATAQAGEEDLSVEADLSGLTPSTVYYVRLFAENANGAFTDPRQGSEFETAGVPAAETFATHAVHGESMRALGSVRPDGLDAHYRFEYVPREQFEKSGTEGGFAHAESTPALDAGTGIKEENGFFQGYETEIVGQDITGLQAGETYDYRIVASNESGSVQGVAHTLTVPVRAPEEVPVACPNARFRNGLSANLPDCRAYEQVTPADKEGAQEIDGYDNQAFIGGVVVAEDGNRLMLEQLGVDWGPASAGQSPYFFTREEGNGWKIASAVPQPQNGVNLVEEQALAPNLTSSAFSSGVIQPGEEDASVMEFKVGSPGGPDVTVAKMPHKDVKNAGGWVTASADFSKRILAAEDRTLAGHPTGTGSGNDLYEYTDKAGLRQLNVTGPTPGTTIGSCGALLAEEQVGRLTASKHVLSADGSRVFFYAIPGNSCSEPRHLYMRTGGAETRDIGVVTFLAANAEGTKALLDKQNGNGEGNEVLLYDTNAATAEHLFSLHDAINPGVLIVSQGFTAFYFHVQSQIPGTEAPPLLPVAGEQNLYRYDFAAHALRFVVQDHSLFGTPSTSPDGRYLYFEAGNTCYRQHTYRAGDPVGVAGLPVGNPECPTLKDPAALGLFASQQLYRYDSVADAVECISCASPFDSEPKPSSTFGDAKRLEPGGFESIVASANGDFAFFSTAAALLPSDVDGEIMPNPESPQSGNAFDSANTSPSSDVYEWRADGVNGCAHVQGCLALITSGRGGLIVRILGSTLTGSDVFFSTAERLVPQDKDGQVDIYDARVGGGFPPPPARPVECEGDACSTPPNPPNDTSPSSFTFSGAGNLTQPVSTQPKSSRSSAGKGKTKKHKKRKVKKRGRGRKAARGRGSVTGSSRRAGR